MPIGGSGRPWLYVRCGARRHKAGRSDLHSVRPISIALHRIGGRAYLDQPNRLAMLARQHRSRTERRYQLILLLPEGFIRLHFTTPLFVCLLQCVLIHENCQPVVLFEMTDDLVRLVVKPAVIPD